jgi:MFS family permease
MMSILQADRPQSRTVAARLPFYYGWVNVILAALAMTATLPGRTHGLGLITNPLCADLALTEVDYAKLNGWAILLGAAFCVPVGRLIDRWGSRVTATGVILALGGVVVLMSGVTGVAALFVLLTLTRGLGQGALSVVSMAMVGKWFERRLGPAMGVFAVLLTIGFIPSTLGLGAAVNVHGWRPAWEGLGLILAGIVAPLSWLLVRSTPEACGLANDREVNPQPPGADALADVRLGAALGTPAFWAYSLATALFGLVWSAITLFNQSVLTEHGFGPDTAVLVMGLLTASGLAFNLLGGWLATRIGMGKLLGLGMLMFAAALAGFPFIRDHTQLIVYALALGAAGGLITVVFFAAYGHAFGRAHLGRIQGTAQVLSVVASAAGPLMLALCKDWTGSYHPLFQGAAIAAALLGAWAWVVPRPVRVALAS